MSLMCNAGFIKWLREVINPQAMPGNSVCLGDYSKDGMTEYNYPKEFVVNGDNYRWSIGSSHTRGRSMSNHYEIWFHGKAFSGHKRIATGDLTKTKLRSGFKVIYNFYLVEDEPSSNITA